MPSISIRNVSKTYPGGVEPVVRDLSLDVEEGEIVALVGPSGCGKTTTLKMINRLIEPSEGTIEVLGDDQRVVEPHELRRRIGYVIQDVGLFPHLKIDRNIGVVPELLGWDARRIGERARELADLVGLDPAMLTRYPSELSGGQQQRVGVARALAADPPILLMDEPYSAVDPIVRERLQDDLLKLQAQVRKTIVIVTHDVDEAVKLGDRMAIMQVGGVLAQYGTPDEVLRDPASDFVAEFLGRERGLRRLALLSVSDIKPGDGPVTESSADAGRATTIAERWGSHWVAVTTDRRLDGWVAAKLLAEADPTTPLSQFAAQRFRSLVTDTTPLREALDVIVNARSRMAAVVAASDGSTFLGFITIDEIAGALEDR